MISPAIKTHPHLRNNQNWRLDFSAKHVAHIDILPRHFSEPALPLTILSLTCSPQRRRSLTKLVHLYSFYLADDDPTNTDFIDVIIIDVDLYGSILLSGVRAGAPDEPIAHGHAIMSRIKLRKKCQMEIYPLFGFAFRRIAENLCA